MNHKLTIFHTIYILVLTVIEHDFSKIKNAYKKQYYCNKLLEYNSNLIISNTLGLGDFLIYSVLQAYFNAGRKLTKIKEKEIERMKNSMCNAHMNNELSNQNQNNSKVFRYYIWRMCHIGQELLPDKYVSCYYYDILSNLLEKSIIRLVPQMHEGSTIKISNVIYFLSLLEYLLDNLNCITCNKERNLFYYELKEELMEISLDYFF